jgi:hypothetical protein
MNNVQMPPSAKLATAKFTKQSRFGIQLGAWASRGDFEGRALAVSNA